MKTILMAAMALLTPAAVLAQEAAAGDAAAGEEQFNRQCIACHVVKDEAGEVLAGRAGMTGPNLYGVAGRQAGTYPDFDYSDIMKAYSETGAVWEEENFVAYVQDPTGFLQEATGEDGRSKMAFQVRDEQHAHDLWAFLATFSPEGAAAGGGTEATEGEDSGSTDDAAEGEAPSE